jgi:hypothetical protein
VLTLQLLVEVLLLLLLLQKPKARGKFASVY